MVRGQNWLGGLEIVATVMDSKLLGGGGCTFKAEASGMGKF